MNCQPNEFTNPAIHNIIRRSQKVNMGIVENKVTDFYPPGSVLLSGSSSLKDGGPNAEVRRS